MKHVATCRALTTLAGAALLAACTVGPDYQRPQAEVPPTWQTDSYWRVAVPSHAPISPDWWSAFSDPTLATLETQALAQNQTLLAASAHYEQARATLANNRAQQIPEVDLAAQASRFRISQNRPQTNYGTPTHVDGAEQCAARPHHQLRHRSIRPDTSRGGRRGGFRAAVGRRPRL